MKVVGPFTMGLGVIIGRLSIASDLTHYRNESPLSIAFGSWGRSCEPRRIWKQGWRPKESSPRSMIMIQSVLLSFSFTRLFPALSVQSSSVMRGSCAATSTYKVRSSASRDKSGSPCVNVDAGVSRWGRVFLHLLPSMKWPDTTMIIIPHGVKTLWKRSDRAVYRLR